MYDWVFSEAEKLQLFPYNVRIYRGYPWLYEISIDRGCRIMIFHVIYFFGLTVAFTVASIIATLLLFNLAIFPHAWVILPMRVSELFSFAAWVIPVGGATGGASGVVERVAILFLWAIAPAWVIFAIHSIAARACICHICACLSASLRGRILLANSHEYTRHANWFIFLLIASSTSGCRAASTAAFIFRSASGSVEALSTFITAWGLLDPSRIRFPLGSVSASIWSGHSVIVSAIVLEIND